MNIKGICFLFLLIVILSCNGSKKQLSFYNNADVEEDSTEVVDSPFDMTISYDPGEEVVVPFIEQGGVKLIDVTINRLYTVKMILDSGCSSTLISIADAKYLYDKGYITQDDILGTTKSKIADGTIVENMVINLRELEIGGQISCANVTAVVSANAQAPLLLGNEVLNRAPSYSVDNENSVIKFRLQ
jgi:predicted aspartyl protease